MTESKTQNCIFIIDEEYFKQCIDKEKEFNTEEYEDFRTTMVITDEEKGELARENLKLVFYVVNSFSNTGVDPDELKSVALCGYEKALTRYNPSRGVKFSTYAYKCIKNEIMCFLRKEKKSITKSISLSQPYYGGWRDGTNNGMEVGEVLPSELPPLDEIAAKSEMREILKQIIENDLTESERLIVTGRFGFNGEAMTQSELAVLVGMSQANISKKEKTVLNKIKKILAGKYNIFQNEL